MPPTKTADAAATKWSQRASAATQDYTAGAAAAGPRWASAMALPATKANFQQGVANSADRYASKAQAAGANGYANGVNAKGGQRYGPGVQAGQNKYQTAVAPYLQVIQGIQLPPRAPRGSAANDARVTAISHALAQRRLGAAAAGR